MLSLPGLSLLSPFQVSLLLAGLWEAVFLIPFLLPPTFPFRRSLFLPLFTALSAVLVHRTTRLGNSTFDYCFANGVATKTFQLYDFLGANYPPESNPDVNKLPGKDTTADSGTWSLADKLKWASGFSYNTRGVGLCWQVVRSPTKKPSNAVFVTRRLLQGLLGFIVQEALQAYMIRFHWPFNPDASLWERTIRCNGCIAVSYLVMNSWHCLVSGTFVGLGLMTQEDYPPLFGDIREAYRIRRLWTHFWHSILRRIFISHGRTVARWLNLPPGSKAADFVQLYVAFFISGLIHAIGAWSITNFTSDGNSMVYFMSQAVAITIEEVLIAAGSWLGIRLPRPWAKLVGFVWSFSWFTYSNSWLVEGLLLAGVQPGALKPTLSTTPGLRAVLETVFQVA